MSNILFIHQNGRSTPKLYVSSNKIFIVVHLRSILILNQLCQKVLIFPKHQLHNRSDILLYTLIVHQKHTHHNPLRQSNNMWGLNPPALLAKLHTSYPLSGFCWKTSHNSDDGSRCSMFSLFFRPTRPHPSISFFRAAHPRTH